MGRDLLAVVTGAASGMGEATARRMHEAGWHVVLCDLDEQRLRANSGAYAPDHKVEFVTGDISYPAFFSALDAHLEGREIGAFINCAGLSPVMAGPERILEVNLTASIDIVEYLADRMAQDGPIVLFASSAAHMLGSKLDERIDAARSREDVAGLIDLCTEPGLAYRVSKRRVLLRAKRQSNRFGGNQVRINSISPGVIDTPMGRAEMHRWPIMAALVSASSFPRAAEVREVAEVARFLCSPAASFITGTDILVDGGSLSRGVPALES
jgi:NAD(P)-dependent dehydrogenase (short-subunit alcohol dehydrogenase family)